MAVTIRRSDFDDFEALQHIVQDSRSEVVQIGSGKMSGTISHLNFNSDFGISTGFYSQGARLRGAYSNERFGITMVAETKGRVSTQDRPMQVGDIAILGPGQERHTVTQAATRYLACFLSPELLTSYLKPHPGALDFVMQQKMVRVISPNEPELRQETLEYLMPLIDGLLEHGPMMPDHTVDFHRRNIQQMITAPLIDSTHYHDSRVVQAHKLVREIDHYTDEQGDRPVHADELCEHFHIYRRALYRAFDEVFGIPVVGFLRSKRLANVHTELITSPVVRISEVAIRHGFLQLGHFAAAYKKQFGELPRETVHRMAGVALSALLWLAHEPAISAMTA